MLYVLTCWLSLHRLILYFNSCFIPRFAQADIHDVAYNILSALFDKIESGVTPEKVSENDYLMKCPLLPLLSSH